MRNLCIAAVSAGLILSPVLSLTAWAGPLSPGQPAGVHEAQMDTNTTMIVLGVGIAAAAIAIAASSGNSGGPTTVTTSPTTTSSTSTTS